MNSRKLACFRLLGAVRAQHDGRDVNVGGDHDQRLLVALLAARSAPLPLDAVIQWIWDRPGPGAAVRCQELMGRLSARLATMGAPAALVAGQGWCRLAIPTDAVDLHRFRKLVATARAGGDEHAADLLRQALELFEGRPFGPLGGERVDNLRTTLLNERMSAYLEYVEVSLRLGRETRILPALAELHRAEPGNEKAAELLRRAYCQHHAPVELNRRIIQQRPVRRESRNAENNKNAIARGRSFERLICGRYPE